MNTRLLLKDSLSALQNLQQKSGSFISLSSAESIQLSNPFRFNTTFSNALILHFLNDLPPSPVADNIRKGLVGFLLSQKSENWTFNYWDRSSLEYTQIPYPDDLDDTFCALSSLYEYDPSLFDGKVFAKITNLLTTLEIHEGGPYRTWIVPDDVEPEWKDVDVAVNANIGYFLHLQDIHLPPLENFFIKKFKHNECTSPYYPTPFPIYYFLSRFLDDSHGLLMHTVKNEQYKKLDNPLNSALIILSLNNLGEPLVSFEKDIENICKLHKKGIWDAYPFYTGVNPKRDQTFFAGSSALTTAVCIHLINRYLLSQKPNRYKQNVTFEVRSRTIVSNVLSYYSHLSKDLALQSEQILHTLLDEDTGKQITLLPTYFAESIGFKNDELLLVRLGEANLYGWIAYTIYDDFLDDEGNPKLLPVANIALRKLTEIFLNVCNDSQDFQKIFDLVMDTIEVANEWELTNCHQHILNKKIDEIKIPNFKDYSQLAQKSLGHALTPLLLLSRSGYTFTSFEIQACLEFFKYYLIARQLHDDAHDFDADIKNGYINSVTSMVLNRLSHKKFRKKISSFTLQKTYWYEVIDEACDLIFEHVTRAQKILDTLTILKDKSSFIKILDSYKSAAQKALDEKEKTLQLLNSLEYSS